MDQAVSLPFSAPEGAIFSLNMILYLIHVFIYAPQLMVLPMRIDDKATSVTHPVCVRGKGGEEGQQKEGEKNTQADLRSNQFLKQITCHPDSDSKPLTDSVFLPLLSRKVGFSKFQSSLYDNRRGGGIVESFDFRFMSIGRY